jgi:type IV pilus assembly protein PilC
MEELLAKIKKKINNFGTVSLTHKIFFIQNLQVMIKAGLSLTQALSALTKQTTNKKLKAIIEESWHKVEKGEPLSQSLKGHPEVFSEVFSSMIETGEASGNLEGILRQLVIQMKKDHELISKVKGALTYPVVVLVAMLAIGIGMIVFVIPKITGIFTEMNATLPLPTRILIGVSTFITTHGILSVLIVVGMVTAFILFIRNPKGKYIWHTLLLKTPIVGPIIHKINLARFSRTLNSLIKTDIPIVQSFQITSRVVGNLIYREKIAETGEKLKKGISITEILTQYPDLFPPVATQMIQVGEQSGNLDELLDELATYYENDVHEIMSNLSSIIEPIMILILGVGVGAMAIAIIMPMYSLSSQI